MILRELHNYYIRMSQEEYGAVPPPGWDIQEVTWALPISSDGLLRNPIFLKTEDNGVKKGKNVIVPGDHSSRSGTSIVPYLLCDKAEYLIGLKGKNSSKHNKSAKKHLEFLDNCKSLEANALRAFFLRENVYDDLNDAEIAAINPEDWCVFLLANNKYAHEVPELQNAWNDYYRKVNAEPQAIGQCSVTGKIGRLAPLFPRIKVPGSSGSGAPFVSFNKESFKSYGLEDYNASITDDVAFTTSTMLRYLFRDARHYVRVGAMTIVFWADRKAEIEDTMMRQMMGGEQSCVEDENALKLIKASLESIRAGKQPSSVDIETRYFVLGISPNHGRLVVRFFEVETLGQIARNYELYIHDIDIVGDPWQTERKTISLFGLLRRSVLLDDSDSQLPASLINSCFRALIRGTAFPSALETIVLCRMRTDHGTKKVKGRKKPIEIMEERAALMKACLVRRRRQLLKQTPNNESEVTMALNCKNSNIGYLLGRLFAVMERAQQGAQGKNVNATIRDKYMTSAATTPARVYGTLLNLCQKHLGTMRRKESRIALSIILEKKIGEIFDLMDGDERPIPSSLSNDDQLMFYIGYYQERVDLCPKHSQDDEKQNEIDNEEE